MPKSEIIDIVKKYANNLTEKGMPFDAVYLFGSQAKGTMREWSDIDIAVISPYLSKNYTEGRFKLWKFTKGIDLRIEPHGFAPEHWLDDMDPMVHEIKKTGVRIV
jgi:uncharacterized protein